MNVYVRRFGKYVAYGVIAVLLSIGLYFLSSFLFAIRTIEVASSDIKLEVDERRIPKNLLLFPAKKIADDLLIHNPLLSSISFIKKYPHTLVIVPQVRKPVARLITPDRRVLIDIEAVVLGEDDGVLALPSVEYPAVGLRVGGTVHDLGVVQAVRVMSVISSIISISRVVPLEERYLQAEGSVQSSEGKQLRILFTHNQDISTLVTTLQTLMTGFRIKGTLPALIDLRFDKPIVTF